MRVAVAVNPSASFGATKSVGARVVAALRDAGHDVQELRERDYVALTRSVDQAVATLPDALVVVGGDGMVNLGANAVAQKNVPLGIVPSGTGNDAARWLGIPHEDPDAATRHLIEKLAGEPRRIDAGRVHWTDPAGRRRGRWFGAVLSAGFDAVVNERANRMRHPKGASRYILAMLVELVRLKPIRYRLTIDGDVRETEALLVAIGNTGSLGGGMKLAPDADPADGLFDVAVVQPFGRIGFLRLFPSVFQGTHVSDPRVEIVRATRVRIETDVIVYADGERVGAAPVEAESVPGALLVYA